MKTKQQKQLLPLWLWLPGLFGLVMAVVTWWLMGSYIEKSVGQKVAQQISAQPYLAASALEELAVIVPRHDLAIGVELTGEQLAVRRLPALALPSDVFLANQAEELFGYVVSSAVAQGKAIQQLHLTNKNQQALSQRLAQGQTAFSLPLDASWTHARSVRVGDQFDFYWRETTGPWRRLLSSVPLLTFAPYEMSVEAKYQGNHSINSYANSQASHAVFAVPVEMYARLMTLQQTQQLVPVLQTEYKQKGPDFLAVPLVVDVLQPHAPFVAKEGEWP